MATVVQKYRCAQIPDLWVIGINSTPVTVQWHILFMLNKLSVSSQGHPGVQQQQPCTTLHTQEEVTCAPVETSQQPIKMGRQMLWSKPITSKKATVLRIFWKWTGCMNFFTSCLVRLRAQSTIFKSSLTFKWDTNEDTLGNDNEKMDSRDVVQPPLFVTAALKIK